MPAFIDLTGRRFGRLTVVRRDENKGVKVRWLCRCDCGGRSSAFANDLRSGRHGSCGCLQKERVTKHGHSPFDISRRTPTYRTWLSMVQRCTNPRATHYDRYGGRGVRVCDRWRGSFAAFLEDMGERPSPRHTVERTDNDGDYTPRNCRWATRKEQAQNRANSRRLTHGGVTRTVTEWAARLGWHPDVIRGRLRLGWPAAEVLTVPPEPSVQRPTDSKTGRFVSRRR